MRYARPDYVSATSLSKKCNFALLVSIGLAAIVALTLSGRASAALPATCSPGYVTGCIIDEPTYQNSVWEYGRGNDGSYTGLSRDLCINQSTLCAGQDASKAQKIRTAIMRGRIAAKFIPDLPTIILAATAFEVGWKIGRTIDTKWLHFSGSPDWITKSQSTPYVITAHAWSRKTVAGGGKEYWLDFSFNSSIFYTWCLVQSANCSASQAAWGTEMHNIALQVGGGTFVTTNETGVQPMEHYVMNEGVGTQLQPDTWRDFNAATDTPTVTTTGWNPDWSAQGFPTKGDQTGAFKVPVKQVPEAVNHVEGAVEPSAPTTTQTSYPMPSCVGLTADQCTVVWGNSGMDVPPATVTTVTLDPAHYVPTQGPGAVVSTDPGPGETYVPGDPITVTQNPPVETYPVLIPEPNINEMYDHYIARLQALGLVGTIIDLTADTGAREDYGPGRVVQVVPAPGTPVVPGTTVVVKRNPLDWPYADPFADPAGDPGGGYPADDPNLPTNAPPPVGYEGSCPCSRHAFDLSPLTSVDSGNKFPFGVFTYAATILDELSVAPEAPSFTFDIPSLNVAGHEFAGSGTWTVDLSFFDSYMATIRTLLSFALTVGTIWMVATKFLGFKAAGDPTGAVDDGMVM